MVVGSPVYHSGLTPEAAIFNCLAAADGRRSPCWDDAAIARVLSPVPLQASASTNDGIHRRSGWPSVSCTSSRDADRRFSVGTRRRCLKAVNGRSGPFVGSGSICSGRCQRHRVRAVERPRHRVQRLTALGGYQFRERAIGPTPRFQQLFQPGGYQRWRLTTGPAIRGSSWRLRRRERRVSLLSRWKSNTI